MSENPKSFLGTGWSFPPRFDEELSQLLMVSDAKDIEESLFILLSTMPGERVTNPEYGCDLHSVIFNASGTMTDYRIKEMIKTAILLWEPRITLEEVVIDHARELEGLLNIQIFYTIRKINVRTNIVYPFYKIEGTNIVEI